VPELASLGRVFRSTAAVPLTENEVEYVVYCVKHIHDDNRHVVLDFSVHNTIQDQMLQQVTCVNHMSISIIKYTSHNLYYLCLYQNVTAFSNGCTCIYSSDICLGMM
jgi:Coatomer gamma subunit appendage platform subdomain